MPTSLMLWVAPSEKDTDSAAMEKRLWDTADQFRAKSGPILGLNFLWFAEVRFAAQRASLEKPAATVRPSRHSLGACCPNETERGCPTRSGPECRMDARKSMGFRMIERAAAETAALRRLRNDSGNTPLGEGEHVDDPTAYRAEARFDYLLIQNPRRTHELTYANYFRAQSYVSRMLKRGLPGEIKRCARLALKS
jgi:hypothetical protein